MTTKKGGGKGKASPSAEKTSNIEDDRTRQEEISDFLKKYEKNFADVPVKDLRHIISLFLMEVYSNIYGQYSRKVRGLWANRPDDWPEDVPFVDPNNKMKGDGPNKNSKPKKDTCVIMLKFLYERYQANRGIRVTGTPLLRPKPDPLISTSQGWRTDSCHSLFDTNDDIIQLPTYADYFADSNSEETISNELNAAISSIGESTSSYAVSESGSDQWMHSGLLHVDDSTRGMFPQFGGNNFASSVAMECVTEIDGPGYVGNGLQYVNINAVDYGANFVDLSQFSNNPLVDTIAFRDIALQGVNGLGIVVNDHNCTTTNKGEIVKPQQVVENELVSENRIRVNETVNQSETSTKMFNKAEMAGVEQGDKIVEVQKFDPKMHAKALAQQVDDCEDPYEWDPLKDSAKRILEKLLHIQRKCLVQDAVYTLLNNAYLFFRRELDQMNPKADYTEKERLVGRAHTLEGCLDICLHLKSLPLEYEEKLKNFVKPTIEEVTQVKDTRKNDLKEETNRINQDDVKRADNGADIDPIDLNIRFRKAAVPSQSLPFLERRPVQQATDTVLLVESGLKKLKDGKKEMFTCPDDSSIVMPDDLKDADFLDSLAVYESYPNVMQIELKEDDFKKKETRSFVTVGNLGSNENRNESSGSLQSCTSGQQHSLGSELEPSYPQQESLPVEASSQNYSPLNEHEMYSPYYENHVIAQSEFNIVFNQQQSYQSNEVNDRARIEQCTDQSTYCVTSPRSDIVKSFADVSLMSDEMPSTNIQRMWQSESYRPVANESSGTTQPVGKGAQRSTTDLVDRPIVRSILSEQPVRTVAFGGKRKMQEDIEGAKVPPAPIPLCVSDANLDDPHFSSHYRKKVKTLVK